MIFITFRIIILYRQTWIHSGERGDKNICLLEKFMRISEKCRYDAKSALVYVLLIMSKIVKTLNTCSCVVNKRHPHERTNNWEAFFINIASFVVTFVGSRIILQNMP